AVLREPVPEPGVVARPKVPDHAAVDVVLRQRDVAALNVHPGERIEIDVLVVGDPALFHRSTGAADQRSDEKRNETSDEGSMTKSLHGKPPIGMNLGGASGHRAQGRRPVAALLPLDLPGRSRGTAPAP